MDVYYMSDSGKKKFQFMSIENELKALQGLVNGNIEVVPLTSELLMIINEEGKINGSKPTCVWQDKGRVLDILYGSVIICRRGNDGEFASVLKSDLEDIMIHLFWIITNK